MNVFNTIKLYALKCLCMFSNNFRKKRNFHLALTIDQKDWYHYLCTHTEARLSGRHGKKEQGRQVLCGNTKQMNFFQSTSGTLPHTRKALELSKKV